MSLTDYIRSLKRYKGFAGDIVCHRTLHPSPPVFATDVPDTTPIRSRLLESLGIDHLYEHQKKAVDLIEQGVHTVVATPTASGKTLIYNLPVMEALIRDASCRALYLFPLKALARDQLDTVRRLLDAAGTLRAHGDELKADVYDGDITGYRKTRIRKSPPHILLSNPEMLHLSMLAHHHLWESFFRDLSFVVVDEVHTYRGVMGSHMAWVFRRFLRICRFYGASPVFVFCSATIANPAGLCEQLIGMPVRVVDRSSAPAGPKDVILMRGLEGAAQTAITLIHAAIHRNLRTICYTQSRKITELIAVWASRRASRFSDRISAYRAGFLPEERRDIEARLASGELLAVVSTSALELGIDIGHLDVCILVGYPGTVMSFWQRAGRVGRDGRGSALIFIAHEDALDQYMINHPETVFSLPPEKAVINPFNRMILRQHLVCAAAEQSLERSEPFLTGEDVLSVLSELEEAGELLATRQGDAWYAAGKFVHQKVNLRGTGRSLTIFLERTTRTIGDIDRHRSFFETHEGAVYLHRGQSYVITRFDHEKGVIEARPRAVPYFTRARSSKSTRIIRQERSFQAGGARVGYGLLRIREQVTGYEKKRVSDQTSLGVVPLDLPELEFETQGFWIEIPDTVRDQVEIMKLHFMGGIHALEHAAIGIMPLMVMTDRNDLGGISTPLHSQTGCATVFVYDGIPGGLGLSEQAFETVDRLMEKTLEVIAGCPCENGCPACVHSPRCGSGNRPIDKSAARIILEQILAGVDKSDENLVRETVVAYSTKPAAPTRPIDFGFPVDSARPGGPAQPNDPHSVKTPVNETSLRYGVLDIETRRSAQEVGGWHRAEKMGVSCAVLYDSGTDIFKDYRQEDLPSLCRDLGQMDLIVGFNLVRFDYRVLSGLSDFDFGALPTLDILLKVHERLGYRLSLDHLARHTLGCRKSADGIMALKWWAEGKMDKIIDYCRQDVRVTRDLYRFGKDNRFLVFQNKAGREVRVPVDW